MKDFQLSLLILRITLGANLLLHGIAKITGGIEPVKALVAAKGMFDFVAYGVYIGEVLAPIMLILGIFTRLSALTILLTCIAMIYFGHGLSVFEITAFGGLSGEIIFLYLGIALTLIICGGGKYSLMRD
ncbi:DoxX family protein [uncultured Campylobacter sp.]|uniref:DoxX family protein n=1 Tax=uncultured Campylobacter sp. TaxID=218934 RepID=UPI002633A7BF|nr:DoxX family protein [uncultured Campylobacter sp.]